METSNSGIEAVMITERLKRPRARTPDCRIENRAFATLSKGITHNPRLIPHRLTKVALGLCGAGSAGISVLRHQPKGDYLHWNAVAGEFASHENVVTPRDFSPCGTVLEVNTAQLFHCPGRFFTYLNGLGAQVVELLVVPIHADDQALGTIWIASHERWISHRDGDVRRFDAHDLRVMARLGEFAAVALQKIATLDICEPVAQKHDIFTSTQPPLSNTMARWGRQLTSALGISSH